VNAHVNTLCDVSQKRVYNTLPRSFTRSVYKSRISGRPGHYILHVGAWCESSTWKGSILLFWSPEFSKYLL